MLGGTSVNSRLGNHNLIKKLSKSYSTSMEEFPAINRKITKKGSFDDVENWLEDNLKAFKGGRISKAEFDYREEQIQKLCKQRPVLVRKKSKYI